MTASGSALAFYDHIWGSGATSCPWWGESDPYRNGIDDTAWPVTLVSVDPESGQSRTHLLRRKDVEEAVRALRDPELSTLLSDPDSADIDADLADRVLQQACFGEVIYG